MSAIGISGHSELHCTCPLFGVKQTRRLHPKLTYTVAKKEYPALLLVRVGNDDHLILADIERH
jgi:hypothetical protein